MEIRLILYIIVPSKHLPIEMPKNQKTAKNKHFLKGVNVVSIATERRFSANFSPKIDPTQVFWV